MRKFTVAVQWVMVANVEVEADNLNDAILKVMNDDWLPDDGECVNGSFEVNELATQKLNTD